MSDDTLMLPEIQWRNAPVEEVLTCTSTHKHKMSSGQQGSSAGEPMPAAGQDAWSGRAGITLTVYAASTTQLMIMAEAAMHEPWQNVTQGKAHLEL